MLHRDRQMARGTSAMTTPSKAQGKRRNSGRRNSGQNTACLFNLLSAIHSKKKTKQNLSIHSKKNLLYSEHVLKHRGCRVYTGQSPCSHGLMFTQPSVLLPSIPSTRKFLSRVPGSTFNCAGQTWWDVCRLHQVVL